MAAESPAERRARLDRAAFGLQRGHRQVKTTPRPALGIDPRAIEPGSVVLATLAERERYAAQVAAELRALVGDAAFRPPASRVPWHQRRRGED